MKLTKKILSLVLAAALLLGTVAIAAQAEGLTTYEGSKLSYIITSDKTVDGVTNVKPGETIKIQVYMTTNYYTGSTGGEAFFWTSNIFESLGSNYVVKSFAKTFNFKATVPVPKTAFPASHLDSSNDTSLYDSAYFYRSYIDDVTTLPAVLDNELLYEISLTVLNDESLVGKTAVFEMPTASVKSPSLTTRKGMICQSVSSTTDRVNDVSSYAATVDLSQAKLEINIVAPATKGEITDVITYSTYVGDTAVIYIDVTDSPESLRIVAPDKEYKFAREDATIQTTEAGETWIVELPINAEGDNACTVYADYGEAGETDGTAFIVEGLVKKEYCDYSALTAAVAKAPEKAKEYYDATEYAAWERAVAAGNELLAAEKLEKSDENQKTINDAAALVEDTLAALDARYLSLAKLNAAVAAYAAIDPADKDYYVAADYEAWQAALAEAKAAQTDYNETMPATKQAEVDAYADALEAAWKKLTADYVDLEKLNNAVVDYAAPAYGKEYYDATAWSNWEAALEEAKAAQTTYATAPVTAQATVDGIADALEAAFTALVPSIVDLTDLNKAIEECTTPKYAAEYYDAVKYGAWQQALEAATTGVTTYTGAANTADNQAAVAALASELRDAFAALVPAFVSTAPITDAIAASSTPAYAAEYYDTDLYAAWEAALAAAQKADFAEAADTEANRAAVAKIAGDLNDAFVALVPSFVSYEKLEAALVAYGAAPEAAAYYTPDSYNAYTAALAAANDANKNRPQPLPAATEANQAAVDKFATDLEAAYKGLTPAGGCSIISVTALQANYVKGDVINFEVLCEGTGFSKIQFITESGSTSTYHRTHSSVKDIYVNEEGNEVWVIAQKVPSNVDVTRYAKAKMGKNWDNGVVSFQFVPTKEDASVKSVEILLGDEAVTEFLNTDTVTIKIVTGPATRRIRLVNPVTGSTSTYSTYTSANTDGTKIWTITRKYTTVKDYAFDIHTANSANILVDSGADLTFTVNKYVAPQVPSTGEVDDAVIAAAVAKARILKGSTQTFTITTDKAAKQVRIVNSYGNTVYRTAEFVSDDGKTKTWVITSDAYNTLGTYNYTVEALYGETWLADADGVLTFKVLY